VTGDAELFWQSGDAIAAILREHRVVRLEMPFTGEHALQFSSLSGPSVRFRQAQALDAVRHVIDLAPAVGDAGWLSGQLAPNTRWAIRKAERSGHVRLAAPADLDAVQAIYAATMRAKGAPVNYGPERFRGMLEELSGAGSARIYVGEVDGRPAGMAAVLDARASRHLLQLAVLPAAQGTRLGDLLVATVIREAISKGQRYFDFMASSPQDTGLLAYKAKWATYPEAIRYAVLKVNPLMDLAVDAGRWLNAQRGRVAAYLQSPPADEPPPDPS
jgi:GNAT superfamily N-acetyltransferase